MILVTINPAYRTHEVAVRAGAVGLPHARGRRPTFKTSDYRAMVDEVRPTLPDLEQVVFLGTATGTTCSRAAGGDRRGDGDRALPSLDADDPINIQYTSGTTGFPKGATLSHRNILNNGFFTGRAAATPRRDRVCIPVPFYHCFGMVLGNLACTTHGVRHGHPGARVRPGRHARRPSQAERCTSLYGVPTMFIAELGPGRASGRYDLSSLRTGIMAGSPCPVEVMKQCVVEPCTWTR